MFPPALPPSYLARMIELRHTVTWRGFSCTNVFHFVSDVALDDDDINAVQSNFDTWFRAGSWPLAPPADYLPFNASLGEIIALQAVAYSKFPVISNHYQTILALDHNDPVVPGHGTAIMVRWFTNWSGRGQSGRSFLGPLGLRALSSAGVGLMTAAAQEALTIAWNDLPYACKTWRDPGTHFRLVLLHSRPMAYQDDPGGWINDVVGGYIPDLNLRSMSRRVPPPLGGFQLGVP